MLTGNQLKALGKRLRDGVNTEADLISLDEYRRSFDPLLLSVTSEIIQLIRGKVPFVLAGRAKRTKSIIRKLKRPENRGMDLSRVADMVGIRVIVKSIEDQDDVLRLLEAGLRIKSRRDSRDGEKPYRAVHLIVESEAQLLEIQIRTLPQHLWADEVESFGERAKEGDIPEEAREYTQILRDACRIIDQGGEFDDRTSSCELMQNRAPITSKLDRLVGLFSYLTTTVTGVADDKSFIVIYDNQLNTTERVFVFGSEERQTALEEYRRIGVTVDESRREVLILNSPIDGVLAITHPRFFPTSTVSDLKK